MTELTGDAPETDAPATDDSATVPETSSGEPVGETAVDGANGTRVSPRARRGEPDLVALEREGEIAADYLEELLDRFSGSYVLSIAAYNAGPARVHQWVDSFGDPRTKTIDVIDWVESIPFTETRNYVQRVLENLQVYRIRLGDRSLAFSLASDLRH